MTKKLTWTLSPAGDSDPFASLKAPSHRLNGFYTLPAVYTEFSRHRLYFIRTDKNGDPIVDHGVHIGESADLEVAITKAQEYEDRLTPNETESSDETMALTRRFTSDQIETALSTLADLYDNSGDDTGDYLSEAQQEIAELVRHAKTDIDNPGPGARTGSARIRDLAQLTPERNVPTMTTTESGIYWEPMNGAEDTHGPFDSVFDATAFMNEHGGPELNEHTHRIKKK